MYIHCWLDEKHKDLELHNNCLEHIGNQYHNHSLTCLFYVKSWTNQWNQKHERDQWLDMFFMSNGTNASKHTLWIDMNFHAKWHQQTQKTAHDDSTWCFMSNNTTNWNNETMVLIITNHTNNINFKRWGALIFHVNWHQHNHNWWNKTTHWFRGAAPNSMNMNKQNWLIGLIGLTDWTD